MAKPVIATDISSSRQGGPYSSTLNLINSRLKEVFEFRTITYDINYRAPISITRILDLKRQIQKIKPDLILVSGLQLSCFHVIIAAKLAGIKHRVVVIHGSSMEAMSLGVLKKVILYAIEFASLFLSTSFYGVSKYASMLSAAKFFKKKNRGYIYNLPCIKAPEKKMQKKDYGFSEDDIVVASSGRITREKGFEYLAEAIETIENNRIKFIIIGDGEYLPQMKARLSQQVNSGRVIFTGYTHNVMETLCAADFFVLPTLHETLSVSLLEASSLNLPLISCRVGGVPEVIEDNYNGILIPPANSEALKTAIERLANNTSERTLMGQNAGDRVKKVFSNEKLTRQVEDLFNAELNEQN